jgi:diaminohydroxyphosphoribosylaminopyrimidine deaminase/5-amino-6-(5-phosphoribosylamino)uracil reductase
VIIGDKKGISAIERDPIPTLKEAVRLHELNVKKLGDSYMFHGYTEQGISLIETPLK